MTLQKIATKQEYNKWKKPSTTKKKIFKQKIKFVFLPFEETDGSS